MQGSVLLFDGVCKSSLTSSEVLARAKEQGRDSLYKGPNSSISCIVFWRVEKLAGDDSPVFQGFSVICRPSARFQRTENHRRGRRRTSTTDLQEIASSRYATLMHPSSLTSLIPSWVPARSSRHRSLAPYPRRPPPSTSSTASARAPTLSPLSESPPRLEPGFLSFRSYKGTSAVGVRLRKAPRPRSRRPRAGYQGATELKKVVRYVWARWWSD